MTILCRACDGAGRVRVGDPLGSCDGPQFGECSACRGSGRVPADGREYAAVRVTAAADGDLTGKVVGSGKLPDGRPFTVYRTADGLVVTTPDWVRAVSYAAVVEALVGWGG